MFYDCVNFRLLLLEPLWRTINFSLKGKLLIYYSSLRHCCCVYGHIYKAPASWPLILRRSLNTILHNLHLVVDLVFSHKIFSDTKKCPNIFFKCKISDSYITSKHMWFTWVWSLQKAANITLAINALFCLQWVLSFIAL